MKYNMIDHYRLHTKRVHETEKNMIYSYCVVEGVVEGGVVEGEGWRGVVVKGEEDNHHPVGGH